MTTVWESKWLGPAALTSSDSDLGPQCSYTTVLWLCVWWISSLVVGFFMIHTSFSFQPSASSCLSACEKSKIVNGVEGHLTFKFITSQCFWAERTMILIIFSYWLFFVTFFLILLKSKALSSLKSKTDRQKDRQTDRLMAAPFLCYRLLTFFSFFVSWVFCHAFF